MKYRKWILCLLMVVWCGTTQADQSALEKRHTTYPHQRMKTQSLALSVLELLGDKRVNSMYVSELVSRLENPETRRKATFALAKLKDKRAVPALLEMLDDEKLDADNKRKVALALATFKEKRAVPVLLEMLNDKEIRTHLRKDAVDALMQIGDERAIPALLNLLDSSAMTEKVVQVIKAFGPSIVPPLLERMKQIESYQIQNRIAHVLGRARDPELAPIYKQVYLETEYGGVESSMSEAFANMGAVGFESLLKVTKQKPNHSVWYYLSTYNGAEAVDAVAEFALDESYPFRSQAIQGLGEFGELWRWDISKHISRLLADADPTVVLSTLYLIHKLRMTESWEEEISKHIPRLLADADPEVKFRTMHLIKLLKMTEMTPALQALTQTTDAQIRNAAHNVLAVLSETTPLTLSVEMDRPRYDYGQPIDLTYRITNVSTHPITICTFAMDIPDEFLELKIQLPDGTFGGYPIAAGLFGAPGQEAYQTLKPGDELTVAVSISYWLHQAGRYTIQIHYDPFDAGIRFGFLGWTRRLTAPKVHFDIEPPTPEHFNRILARIDTKPSTSEAYDRADKTCHQLGELRKPEAIPALKKLGLDSDGDYRFALAALAKFPNRPELIPMWIEMLNDVFLQSVHTTVIKALGASGDPRAIEPLRRASYRGNYTIGAALALQQLGDDSGIERLRNKAWRKLQHRNKRVREQGVQILRQLQPRRNERQSRRKQPPDPQQVLTNTWLFAIIDDRQLGIKWVATGAKAVTLADVEGLLEHPNPKIQKSAAYALARLGNASGAHLIRPDLYAKEVSTRQRARDGMLYICRE